MVRTPIRFPNVVSPHIMHAGDHLVLWQKTDFVRSVAGVLCLRGSPKLAWHAAECLKLGNCLLNPVLLLLCQSMCFPQCIYMPKQGFLMFEHAAQSFLIKGSWEHAKSKQQHIGGILSQLVEGFKGSPRS